MRAAESLLRVDLLRLRRRSRPVLPRAGQISELDLADNGVCSSSAWTTSPIAIRVSTFHAICVKSFVELSPKTPSMPRIKLPFGEMCPNEFKRLGDCPSDVSF